MSSTVWRSYYVAQFRLRDVFLRTDGRVEIGKSRFSKTGAINETVEGSIQVVRPEGIGQFLLIKRPQHPPIVFRHLDGEWQRWVRLYPIESGHFQWRDIVRTWGLGVPFYFLCWLAAVSTLGRGIYLMWQSDISWGRVVVGLLVLVMVIGWLTPRDRLHT